MKMRTQILTLGLAGIALATLVGGAGLMTNTWLSQTIESTVTARSALQASQRADMMHDAVRGDTLLGMVGALQSNPASIEEAQRDLDAHGQLFQEVLAQLAALPLDDSSRQALEKVQPLVVRYLAAARQTLQAARVNAQEATGAGAQFQQAFEVLEQEMGALSESIEQDGLRLTDTARQQVERAQWGIAATLLLASLLATGTALWLARHMTEPIARAIDSAHRLAEGDLTEQHTPQGSDEAVQLQQAIQQIRSSLGRIVTGVQASAEQVASASVQIAQGNNDLSRRTEEQASALEQTSATMEQLGTTVRHNADHAQQANRLAQEASTIAGQGGMVMAQVSERMHGIHTSSHRITDIIAVIDGIAFQTNILALNAAVEAARAGEQGRGFAVVASEVRSLAQRSASAAREIKGLVTGSVEQVQQGTTLVEEASRTMTQIVASIQQVHQIMAEISTASREQSLGVSQVGQAVTQMDSATQQNAAMIEESAAAANTLKAQAQELVAAVSVFRLTARAHHAPTLSTT